MAEVAYGWTVTILTGRRLAEVAYGWMVTILSYLRVDV